MAKIEKQVWLVQFDGASPSVCEFEPRGARYVILAGPVSVTFDVPNACPHCGVALPEAVAREALVIEVGMEYKTRDGRTAFINRESFDDYPMSGEIESETFAWTKEGRFYDNGEECHLDLVERIS